MGNSKKWLALTDEERRVKRRMYRLNHQTKHPEGEKASSKRYRERNREAIRIAALAYRHTNRERVVGQSRETRRELKRAAIAYLGGVCVDCGGVFPPAAFDFHHEGDKDWGVAGKRMVNWEQVKVELEKCVLLCSNCHRVRHHGEE